MIINFVIIPIFTVNIHHYYFSYAGVHPDNVRRAVLWALWTQREEDLLWTEL